MICHFDKTKDKIHKIISINAGKKHTLEIKALIKLDLDVIHVNIINSVHN
jgi:hypothetical protein